MKTLKLKYLITLMLIVTGSVSFCQNDSDRIYYTNDIIIDYVVGPEFRVNKVTGDSAKVLEHKSINDISKLTILNDSLIRVSKDNLSDAKINIDKISTVSIKGGSAIGAGLVLGALTGMGIGIVIGANNDSPNSWLKGAPTLAGGLIGFLSGALIGGLMGSSITGYEEHDLDFNSKNKKNELVRILEIDKFSNGD